MKRKYRTVYRVENPSAGRTEEYASRAKAMKRARARARRECGEVAVHRSILGPGEILREHGPGTGFVWRSEWKPCHKKRRR